VGEENGARAAPTMARFAPESYRHAGQGEIDGSRSDACLKPEKSVNLANADLDPPPLTQDVDAIMKINSLATRE
jgi:hypothetical protein